MRLYAHFRRKTTDYIFYIDNAKTYTRKKVYELFENQEFEVLYAVPYMPELNAIEFFINDINQVYKERIFNSR